MATSPAFSTQGITFAVALQALAVSCFRCWDPSSMLVSGQVTVVSPKMAAVTNSTNVQLHGDYENLWAFRSQKCKYSCQAQVSAGNVCHCMPTWPVWHLKSPRSRESCYLHSVSGAKPLFCSCGLGPRCPSLIWSQLQRISKKFFEVFGI